MNSPSDYLKRLRAERDRRLRQERLVRQASERLRQQREQESQDQLRDETLRARIREDWANKQRREEQRQALSARLVDEARRQRLEEQRSRVRTDERPEAPRTESSDRAREPRIKRREALGKRTLAEEQRWARLVSLRDGQRHERQAEEAGRRRHQQRRATRVEELRRQQVAAEAASGLAQDLRAKEVKRRQKLEKPALELQQSLRPPLAARPSASASQPVSGTSAPPPRPIPEDVELSWLSTQGNFLVDENGHPVYLRGVTVAGLDNVNPAPFQMLRAALALDDANLSSLSDRWEMNLIRLPFRSSTILRGNASLTSSDILAGLDDLMEAASSAGCYVLLAMVPGAEGPNLLPSDDDYLAWRNVAIHYRDEPAVLYELFSSTSVLAENWVGIAAAAIGTVRTVHTASLLFVGNGQASTDVSGLPMRFGTGDPMPNLVYTVRVTPELLNAVDEARLHALADAHPVFATEWLDDGHGGERLRDVAANLFGRFGIGWVASYWNQEPRLVVNAAASNFSPTRWGLAVQRAQALPVKPQYVAFRLK